MPPITPSAVQPAFSQPMRQTSSVSPRHDDHRASTSCSRATFPWSRTAGRALPSVVVITLEEARAFVVAACTPLPVEEVPLAAAVGLVVATPVTAAEDVPPFANTAVDGFAVRAASVDDAPVVLTVVATVAAGAARDEPLGPGEAVRIMTGAPMPPGADAVVMVEDSEPVGTDAVRLLRSVASGDAVRLAASDVRAGATVLTPGTVVGAAHLGVLASIGRTTVPVHRRPRVGVLSTGDELVSDGSPLGPGQIRESNKHMLLALVAAAGAEPVDLGVVRDDEAALERALADAAARCDALVTSGGVSMGDFDIVKAVLSRLAEMRWMQIAIKPAKPFAFGVLPVGERRVPVIGLPGNPVSSFVSFELLARPALRRLAGHAAPEREPIVAIADDGLSRRPDGKTHWVRVYGGFGPDGRLHVRVTGPQGSHQLAATAGAQGLAEVVDGDGVSPGGDVPVLWFALTFAQ